MKKFRFTAVLATVLLLLPVSAFAAVTGNLQGVVTDSTGAALPGVTVTATSPQLQGSRTGVTGSNGDYNLQSLPPGTYRMEFMLSGFDTVVKENVRVALDVTSKVDATLGLGAVSEAITVTADAAVIDPTQTTTQQNFGTQHLKYATIGTAGRSYQSVLQQAAGVAGGSNPNVMGANSGQNNYMLDGVNTTDPVTHTFGSNLPFDAVQEISIQTLGKDAEYGRAIGGIVNVVTKSGGNDFSGTFDARLQDDTMSESGDHYDASTQDYKEFKPAGTLGGPIVRDRVWFFGSLERPDNVRENTPRPGADWKPGSRTFQGWNSLAKITASPWENQTLSFRYTDNSATVENANNSAFYRPEADYQQVQESTIYNLGYDVILNPQWLATAQVGIRRGGLDSVPMNGDLNTIGITNNTTSIRWNAYTNQQGGDRNRDELILSSTYFLNAAGAHTIKAGINFDESEFSSYNDPTGLGVDQALCATQFGQPAGARCGASQINLGGDVNNIGTPRQLNVTTVNGTETYNAGLRAYYIQDEWHPVNPVTLRVGLRYEEVQFETPGVSAPSLDKLQPRIGAAWDVFNNANTVVHGFWGQVMDDNGLTLASFLSGRGAVTSRFLWDATNSRWNFHSAIGGASGNQYDPDLKPAYGEEANLGVTQRVGGNSSVDFSYVQRETKDQFEDACHDEECHYFELTNKPWGQDVIRSEYEAFIAKLETRPFSWLSGLVSYTWSESKGSVEYTQNAGADFDIFPDHFVNTFGYLSDDARHRVKIAGYVRAPWGTTFGVDAFWRSGLATNTTASLPPNSGYGALFVEERGSRRTPDAHGLDMQVMHEFNIGRFRPALIASVFNVLNTETPLSLGTTIGAYAACGATDTKCIANPLYGVSEGAPERLRISSTTFGQETSWQRPRRYELGVRFEF